MTVTVLIADDHPLVRFGLRNLLASEPDFTVAGEAEDGLKVLALAEKIRPDILVVDLMMPNLNGLEVIRTVRHRLPGTRMIVLSMQRADPYIVEAFKAGAIGYVLKDDAPGEVIHAIREALRGVEYLSPGLSDRLVETAVKDVQNAPPDAYELLTERERQVFQLAVEGKTAPEIARALFISPRTAEAHRSRVMDKLGVHNQTDLVKYALKRGVLSMEA